MKLPMMKYMAAALCLVAVVSLAACTKPAPTKGEDSSTTSSQSTSQSSSSSSQEESEEQEAEKEEMFEGTVNTINTELDMIVLATDQGYYKFNINGVDLAYIEPGDFIKVIYTGTLEADSDDVTADLVAIVKN